MRAFAFFILASFTASAGEYAVLSNGFRIHAQRHSVSGEMMRLATDQGDIEVPVSSVNSIEVEEYTAPPPPTPVVAATPAPAATPVPIDPKQLITEAAQRAGLPSALVHSIARAESAYRAGAVSPKGAIGLMQLMPKTAASMNANPYDPKENADAGAMYLRELLLRYENDPPHQVSKAVAAYNAGPGAVDKYNGVPPYRETVDYVNRVVSDYLKHQNSQQ